MNDHFELRKLEYKRRERKRPILLYVPYCLAIAACFGGVSTFYLWIRGVGDARQTRLIINLLLYASFAANLLGMLAALAVMMSEKYRANRTGPSGFAVNVIVLLLLLWWRFG